MHSAAAAARRIPSTPPSEWKPAAESAWARYLSKAPKDVYDAIDSRDPLLLFNALWDLMLAPSRVIGPFFPRKGELDRNTVRCAIKKVLIGQEGKAVKLLMSNGIAAATPQVIQALRDLHPDRSEELILPEPHGSQVSPADDMIYSVLFDQAECENAPKDTFGWSAPLFLPTRALAKGGLLTAVSKLLALAADQPDLFPEPCAQLLSTGWLTPLNKVSKIERRIIEQAGGTPKVRPINAGTLFAKTLLAATLKLPEAQQAAKRVYPYQLSLGARRGTERLVHTARAAHLDGWIVGKNDVANGFNTVHRQSLIDAHHHFFPQCTKLFNFLYGVDAPILLEKQDGEIETLWSRQGARQGCTAGTEAFCFAVDGPVRRVHHKYPEFVFKVLTDDIITLCPPPESDTEDAWREVFVRYASMLKDLAAELATIGLAFNRSKSELLLPRGARGLAHLCPELNPQSEGIVVAGAPIGTDVFISDFVKTKLAEWKGKLPAILGVARKSPRAAHRLLTVSATRLPTYFASTIPPEYTYDALREFDHAITDAFFQIVDPQAQMATTGEDRVQRALLKVTVPTPRGCGLFIPSDQAAISWWASLQASLSEDRDLFRLREALRTHVRNAWPFLSSALTDNGVSVMHTVAHVIATSEDTLLDGSMFYPGVECETHVAKYVLRTCTRIRSKALDRITGVGCVSQSFSNAEFILAGSSGPVGSIFARRLSARHKEPFTAVNYIHFVRFFLGLPPVHTVGDATVDPNLDYPVQRCIAHQDAVLDASACHASSCTSANFARTRKHNHIVRVIASMARSAGLETSVEPQTHRLLLEEFTPAQCRSIFPSRISAAYRSAFTELSEALKQFDDVQHPGFPSERKQRCVADITANMPAVAQRDLKGLRVDLSVVDPKSGQTFWADVTIAHTAAPTYQVAEMAFTAAHRELTALRQTTTPSLPCAISPTLTQREAHKSAKYARLIQIATRQYQAGMRARPPAFAPVAMSTTGSLGSGAATLLDWICSKFHDVIEESQPRPDGFTTKHLSAGFRGRMFHSIHCLLASGLANQIAFAGGPAPSRRSVY